MNMYETVKAAVTIRQAAESFGLTVNKHIKSMVTLEDKMDIERKGQQSVQRELYVRFIAFGNGTLQALYDHSYAFYRRQLILTTKDRPADRVDDRFLVEKFKEEAEGIFLWMLQGLHSFPFS